MVMTDKPETNSPPSEQSESELTEAPLYRDIPPDELQEILEQNRKWVESDKKEGVRADLSWGNLQKLLLDSANMQMADLWEANLQETHLAFANLQGALLFYANLQKATLNNAILREANLQDADLSKATGLLASQFAGANVSGAKLPKDIAQFDGLIQVEEISKKAGKLFISMLLGCVYAWLTIATTTDVALLTNSSSSPLAHHSSQNPHCWILLGRPANPIQPVPVAPLLPPTVLARTVEPASQIPRRQSFRRKSVSLDSQFSRSSAFHPVAREPSSIISIDGGHIYSSSMVGGTADVRVFLATVSPKT